MSTYPTPVQVASGDQILAFLCEEIERTAQEMERNQNLLSLQALQRWCDTVVSEVPPNSAIVPLYYLSQLLDDALENLTTDIPSKPVSNQLRSRFFTELPALLSELASRLADHSERWPEPLEEMTSKYLRLINELNVSDEHPVTHSPVEER